VVAIQALEGIANEEFGPEKAIEEAVKVVASFSDASFVGLWLTDEQGSPTSRAEFADGEVILFDGSPLEPADEDVLRQVVEYRKPIESRDGDDASYFFPLLSGQTCFGIVKITVAGLVVVDQGDAAQRLSAQLGRVARHLGRAIRAPVLYDQAVVDTLTGLYTRRHFVNRLSEATGVSRRYGEPLSLILIDVDNFKMLNATYGTPTGDRVLRNTAALVQQNVREIDGAFRYGSDEIAIILPDTEVGQARSLADRLCRIVRDSRALSDDGGAIITTVSIGVTEFDEDMRGIGPLLARVEEALYAAKDAGRDRVETWSEAAPAAADEQTG
jgi:diguanylate cyclase (GGDEF)-like protein